MPIKFMFLLVLIYTIEKGFASLPTDEDRKEVYLQRKKAFWETCKSSISEESLNIFEDDLEADNEEIRMYKLCIAEFSEYIKNNKLDTEKISRDTQKYFPMFQAHEIMGLKIIMKSCKNSAEQASDKYAVLHEFSICLRRESKVQFD